MMDLTVMVVTQDAPHARAFVEDLHDATRGIGRFLLAVDAPVADWMTALPGAHVTQVTSDGFIESVLDDVISRCPEGYVLRVDDDERLSPPLLKWLEQGGYRDSDHWAFPRANLIGDAATYIVNPPLWPDLQTRLSVKAKAGGRPGVHDGSPHGTGTVAPDGCIIEHHKFLVRDRAEREALLERYESIREGAGNAYAMFSVPELYADLLRLTRLPYAAVPNAKADRLLAAASHLRAGSLVVEIGCARNEIEMPSDGWSTVHLARAAKERNWEFHSVDINPEAVRIARTLTRGTGITVHHADGETWLAGRGEPIDLLYLDGAADPTQAVAQYRAATLDPECVIVIDDIQPIDGVARGKGDVLLDELAADGFRVEIHDTEPGYKMAVCQPATRKVQLPHLDLMVCTACQLRCVGCTNGMGIVPMEVWPLQDVLDDARNAAKVMHADTVCLLGGEPTSHPRLVEIMREVRAIGLGDRIQVLTNGMRLHRMSDAFWSELEWLKVSIYPGKTPEANVELAKQKAAGLGFQLDFYDVADDPFRAVLTDRERTPDSAQKVYDGCWYRTFTRKVEQGYFYRCCTSPSISKTVLGLDADVDGIALDGLTPQALHAFLDRKEPMKSCERCYGNLGPRLEQWAEERAGHDEWMAASMVALPMAEAA